MLESKIPWRVDRSGRCQHVLWSSVKMPTMFGILARVSLANPRLVHKVSREMTANEASDGAPTVVGQSSMFMLERFMFKQVEVEAAVQYRELRGITDLCFHAVKQWTVLQGIDSTPKVPAKLLFGMRFGACTS